MGKRILACLIVSSQISVGVATTVQRFPVKVLAVWEHDVWREWRGQKKAGQRRKDLSLGEGRGWAALSQI